MDQKRRISRITKGEKKNERGPRSPGRHGCRVLPCRVLWALTTRSNPEMDIEIIRRSWSGPLDPIIPKGQKGHSSRAIIDACPPYEWLKDFPRVAASSPEVRRAAEEKWRKTLSS